jgi:hypothetical protein
VTVEYIFRDILPLAGRSSSYFKGTYCLHPQGQRERQARSRWEAELLDSFLLDLLFDLEDGDSTFL